MTDAVPGGDTRSEVSVPARLATVHERIEAAGRPADEVTVVAVTKGFGPDAVEAAVAAGLRDVGENYARELSDKAAQVPQARWHHLGTVQRGSVGRIADVVDLWQGVDRLAAGEAIARRRPGAAVLVQVNLTGAPERSGVAWGDAAALVEGLSGLGLTVRGLMGVGPKIEPRPVFRRLARLNEAFGLTELSMGMTDDLEIAVQEGATMVRVGRGLFGARPAGPEVRR